MKFCRIAIATSLAAVAITQVHAEEYQGVLLTHSFLSRAEVHTQAIEASHAPNPYSDAASSVVAAPLPSPRDRATVQVEARARAHAPNQNVRAEAFAGSRIPPYYNIDHGPSKRQTSIEDSTKAPGVTWLPH